MDKDSLPFEAIAAAGPGAHPLPTAPPPAADDSGFYPPVAFDREIRKQRSAEGAPRWTAPLPVKLPLRLDLRRADGGPAAATAASLAHDRY